MAQRLDRLSGHLAGNATASSPPAAARSPEEQTLRVELAAAYRLAAMFGWEELIYNHFTCRLPQNHPNEPERFLINSFGMGFDEVTASSLVTVDVHGKVVDPGSRAGVINPAGYVIHSAVHEARQDATCVLHVHQSDVVAISARKEGLLPVGQSYYALGQITTHDYEGIALLEGEKVTLVRDLGPTSNVMMLKNHGCLTLGRTVPEAFVRLYFLILACQQQVRAGHAEQLAAFPPLQVQALAGKQATGFSQNTGRLEFDLLVRRYEQQFGTAYKA